MTSLRAFLHELRAGSDLKRAIAELRRLEYLLPSQEARFAVPFAFRGRGLFHSIRPRQTPVEIEGLYRAISRLSPRATLEIGTAKGGTLYLWAQASAPDATVLSIDCPSGGEGGYPAARVPLHEAFGRPDQRVRLLQADSKDPATVERVRTLLCPGRKLDFLFIDGDHTLEGVRADFRNYAPLVREGGRIGFHDILAQPWSPTTQVHVLWDEL